MKKLVKYNLSYKKETLNLFDSNVPEFFDPTEREPFVDFLSKKLDSYYIYQLNDKVVGAGGYWNENTHEARICWLMIDRHCHKEGIGKYMMNQLHHMIKKEGIYNLITLKTAQDAEGFYKKLGYETTYFEKDHWAEGLDLYFMEHPL